MITAAGIETEEEEFAGGIPKVVDCILTARDGVFEREADTV